MCGRFTIMIELDELREQLSLGELPIELTPSHNITPGQMIPVIVDGENRNVDLYKWGLIPGWAKDPQIGYKMINARAETIAEKPSFRNAFLRQRCLIPADGFYEWKSAGGRKSPYLFTLKDHVPFTFAGLWEIWKNPEGKEIRTCTIITTSPNSVVAEYHDRMPVILGLEERWEWLKIDKTTQLQSLLKPFPPELMAIPQKVSKL